MAAVINDNGSNATTVADALEGYFDYRNQSVLLTPGEIDRAISRIPANFSSNSTSEFFIMSQATNRNSSNPVIGATLSDSNGSIVVNTTRDRELAKTIKAGIIFNISSENISNVRAIIIEPGREYQNISHPGNGTVGSLVVVAYATDRLSQSVRNINIALYFRVNRSSLPQNTTENLAFVCSFYDNTMTSWNDSGCSSPRYNETFDRYECTCSHLTSFALLWLSRSESEESLTSEDIASLVFQSVSIVCFLVIIVHSIYTKAINPTMTIQANDLLSLLSCATTMVLFTFYIALTLTVFLSKKSTDSTVCSLTDTVLMFFVYFLLILMFCIKTSIAFFNYVRFVQLFPQPSYRKLHFSLLISLLVAIVYVSFAAGFNSNSDFGITQVYSKKICWFTRRVLHYFLTIPIGICLLANLLILGLVARRLFYHVKYSTSPHQTFQRMQRCLIVLLASCVTQGIGWILGPIIATINVGEKSTRALQWSFIVCNGLEGLWCVLLYLFLRQMRIDEQKRLLAAKHLKRKKTLTSTIDKSVTEDERGLNRQPDVVTASNLDRRRREPSFINLRDARNNASSDSEWEA